MKSHNEWTTIRWIPLVLIMLCLLACGSAPRHPGEVDNDMRVWGHELAHCVHGFFHDSDYDRNDYDFETTYYPENVVVVVPYRNIEQLRAAYREHHNGREAAEYTTGFFRRTGGKCYIYVPALKPANW